jgi:hypothetical protein
MNDEPSLYGPDNQPLSPRKSDRDVLEALIRSELADAKAQLKDSNQVDLRQIKEDWSKPWKRAGLAFFIGSIVLNVWFFFQGKEFLAKKAEQATYDKLTDPYIRNIVTVVAKSNAQEFVTQQLKPMEQHVNSLGQSLSTRQDEITNVLFQSQTALMRATNILEFLSTAASASAFDYDAWERLAATELSTNAPENDIAWRTRMNVKMMVAIHRLSQKGYSLDTNLFPFDPATASLPQFEFYYQITPSVIQKCVLLSHLATARHLNKVEVFDYLISQVRSERNWLIIQHIGELLRDEFALKGIQVKFPDGIQRVTVVNWWEANRSNFASLVLSNSAEHK